MPSLLLWTGNTIHIGDTRITYGSILMVLSFVPFTWISRTRAGTWTRSATTPRRRARGRADQPRVAQCRRGRRADLRGGRVDAHRPHRAGEPAGRRPGEPRLHHG